MKAYISLLGQIIKNGVSRADRTGTGRSSIFGFQLRHSMDQGFPLLTTKKIHFKSVVHELLWLISGDTNIHYLQSNGVNIWNEWADEKGELGPVYGQQWRRWQGPDGKTYDQLQTAIHLIKTEPHSTRMIVNSWNVADISKMALPPCHAMFQFFCADGKLSLQLYQRSADIFLVYRLTSPHTRCSYYLWPTNVGWRRVILFGRAEMFTFIRIIKPRQNYN